MALGASVLVIAAHADPTWSVADGVGDAAGTGTVTVPAGTELGALTVAPGAGGLAFAGEGLSFTGAAASVVQVGIGSVAYDVPIAAAGSLAITLDTATGALTYDATALRKDVPVTAFPGIDVAEYVVTDAVTFGGESMQEGLHYQPYHAARGDGWLTVQMQIVEGGWTKCVKVRLQQNGADVEAFIVYAKYLPPDRIGADFDLEGNVFNVSDAHGVYGYGVKGLSILYAPTDRAEQTFTKSLQAGGLLTFGSGLDFAFSGDAALSADGSYAGDLCVSNTVAFKNRRTGTWALSGGISGGAMGVLRFAPWDLPPEVVPAGSRSVRGAGKSGAFDYFTTTWQDVVQDVPYGSVTGMSATMQGPNIVPLYEHAHVEFVSNGVDRAFYQAQVTDGYWYKVVDLELRNTEGGMLQVRAVQAQYCPASAASSPYMLTLADAKAKGGDSYGLGGYCVNQLDIEYASSERPPVPQHAALTGANTMSQGRIEVEGTAAARTYVTISDKNAVPPDGSLDVRTGGVVTLDAPGLLQGEGYRNGTCTMCVYAGGELLKCV